jgi:hypothetical protein
MRDLHAYYVYRVGLCLRLCVMQVPLPSSASDNAPPSPWQPGAPSMLLPGMPGAVGVPHNVPAPPCINSVPAAGASRSAVRAVWDSMGGSSTWTATANDDSRDPVCVSRARNRDRRGAWGGRAHGRSGLSLPAPGMLLLRYGDHAIAHYLPSAAALWMCGTLTGCSSSLAYASACP